MNSSNVYSHATITILDHASPGIAPGERPDWTSPWNIDNRSAVVDTLPSCILQATQLMVNLRSLALDLRALSPAQANELVTLLPIGPKWERISHLKIFAGDDLTLAAITHCTEGTLKALSINVDTDSLAYKKAVKTHRGLQRLRVLGTVTDLKRSFGVRAIARAAKSFKSLKWLAVSCGTRESMNGPMFPSGDLPDLVSTYGRSINGS